MKHSKDLKLILLLLVIEFVLIAALAVFAALKYGGIDTGRYKDTLLRLANVGDKLFPDSGRLNVGADTVAITPGIPASPTPEDAIPTAEPTEIPIEYNYYSFIFDENGYRSVSLGSDDFNSASPGCTFDNIKESKFVIPGSKAYLVLGNINIENNYVGKELPLSEIFETPLKLKKMERNAENQFIVYYTHTYEGYCLTEEEQLHEKRWYTTDDNNSNVVAAGTAFYEKLVSAGINGVNNLTVHNDGYDALKSYDISLETLKSEVAANPDALLTLDVHRNGYGKLYKGKLYGPTVGEEDEKYAKIMFVIGLDYDSETGSYSYETNPYWKENFKLVFLLMEKLEERVPGITSGIALRRTPYNQGETPNSLLVEIGFEGNLVSEAQRTTSLLADIIAEVYG